MSKLDDILTNMDTSEFSEFSDHDIWWAKQQIKDEYTRILKASLTESDPYVFIEKEIAQL